MARTKKTPTVVAEICLYGTHDSRVGAGYLGVVAGDGPTKSRMFGTGEPEPERIFTEALWIAVGELRARGINRGLVRVFDSGGGRMASIDLGAFLPMYGDLKWEAAPVYTVQVADLVAASETAQ